MSTFPNPPEDTAGPGGDTNLARPATPRRPAAHVRPDADFELMLLLRGAARTLDLRNRVVRARRRPAASPPAAAPAAGPPSDPAHPA